MKKILSFVLVAAILMSLCVFFTVAAKEDVTQKTECVEINNDINPPISTALLATETESATYDESETYGVAYTIGDANSDDKVNVKDATVIQKWLADLVTLNEKECIAADVDGDGKLSVKDATAIQKWLANVEIEFLIGEQKTADNVSVYINIKTFSSQIHKNADYTDDKIIVMPREKSGSHYTLENFTEYKFSSIEIIGGTDYVLCYVLRLKNPGKENVIEAIRSLDYRADLDLEWVQPNYISYPFCL